MDKDRIQQVADRMTQERYDRDFYQLSEGVRVFMYDEAQREVIDEIAAFADAMKGRDRDAEARRRC